VQRSLLAALRIILGAVSVLIAFIVVTAFLNVIRAPADGTETPADAASVVIDSTTTTSTTTTTAPILVADPTPTTPPVNCEREAPTAADGRMVVRVAYRCGPPDALETAWVYRDVEETTAILTATTRQLIAGPSDEERADGYASVFSAETTGLLASVKIFSGAVAVDFNSLEGLVGIDAEPLRTQFLADLNASLFQYDQVASVEYQLRGSCESFWEALGVAACDVITRADWDAQEAG
jgi:spore germination protein GerM